MPNGGRRLPPELLDHLRRADLVLHAGDLVAGTVLDELRAYAPVQAVHGNNDHPELQSSLPRELVVEAGGAHVAVVHDAGRRKGREERLRGAFPGCSAIVYGHTHVPQVERHGGVWILNPGSPTERRRATCRSFLVLELRRGAVTPRLVELSASNGGRSGRPLG